MPMCSSYTRGREKLSVQSSAVRSLSGTSGKPSRATESVSGDTSSRKATMRGSGPSQHPVRAELVDADTTQPGSDAGSAISSHLPTSSHRSGANVLKQPPMPFGAASVQATRGNLFADRLALASGRRDAAIHIS